MRSRSRSPDLYTRVTSTLYVALYRYKFTQSWIAFPVDEEYIHPSWMIIPVGNLVGAVTARLVDPAYIEWGWFQFSLGSLLWLALWPTTFRKVRPSNSLCWFKRPRWNRPDYVGFRNDVTFEPARFWYCLTDLVYIGCRRLPPTKCDMSLGLFPPPTYSLVFADKAL